MATPFGAFSLILGRLALTIGVEGGSMTRIVDDAVAILERTPAVLRHWLGGQSERWTRRNYGAGTWSPFDIVGHLIHGERTDWIPRARIILEHGPERRFEPFDRFAQLEENRGRSMDELLATFGDQRVANLEILDGLALTESQLDLGGTHPELGRVTLGELIATWATHDLAHIAQIARAQAHQNRDDVGPWRDYMGILGR